MSSAGGPGERRGGLRRGGGAGLHQTGQTNRYDSSGTPIACAGTGQDGDVQAGAAGDATGTCAVAKRKAAGQKLVGKLECHGIAIKKCVAVDSDCLDKVETKFVDAFTKVESRGGCATTDDADNIELLIDGTLEDLLTALPGGPTTTTMTMPPPSCDVGDCSSCQICSSGVGSACESLFLDCFNNSWCWDLNTCYDDCSGDQNRVAMCQQTCSIGVAPHNALTQCVLAECPTACIP